MRNEYMHLETIYCPTKGCKGMLLQNPYYHEMKCSYCDNYFIQMVEYKKCEKPKEYVKYLKGKRK